MAKEIMERKASDNKYLHKDFHNFMNLSLEYLREKFGEEAVRDYLRQFALSFYKPLIEDLKRRGLIAIKEYKQKIYEIEESKDDVEFLLSENELIINVKKCPAVAHMKQSGISVSPLYYETIKTVSETICEKTPFAFELSKYDNKTGASIQRFYRREM